MRTLLSILALSLLLGSTTWAQAVTKREAVKTTKIAKKKAKQLQKDADSTGNQPARQEADKTLDAAKRAQKQAKKNP